MNVLLARTDRLGDVLQSMAGVRSLKSCLGNGKIGFLIAKANEAALRGNPFIDRLHYSEAVTSEELKRHDYGAAVVMFFDKKTAAVIKRAGIPQRIGPLSKIASFFYFNRGVRQHRSASIKNEAEYNLDLIRALCPSVIGERPVIFNPGVPPSVTLPKRYVVVAPQSRNSSPNISDEQYRHIAAHLSATGVPIVLCGTERGGLCGRIASECQGDTGAMGTTVPMAPVDLCGKTTLDELISVIRGSLFVIAPSTGTLHLANALGRPILSFYPPNKTASALRWSPYRYEGRIFTASYPCRKKCRKSRACSDRCMNFDVEEIKREIAKLLDLQIRG
ncbi:MAG: glycosyltransferase family 9 protein [Chitinispirillaceae bacterium]|jgi:ADP-heptose:LPS heptosyltransferase